jgi:hypothetical protein
MLNYFFFPLIIAACISCSSGTPTASENNASMPVETASYQIPPADTTQIIVEGTFHDFLKKFKPVKLPFHWGPHSDAERHDNIDPSFYKFVQTETALYYVMLEDTSKFYSLITLGIGDDFVPILTTYNKSGTIIDSKTIVGPGCGPNPCILCYPSYSVIEKDLSIHAVDSILFISCDQNDKEIPGNDTLIRHLIDGKLNPDGTIEMGPMRKVKEKFSSGK